MLYNKHAAIAALAIMLVAAPLLGALAISATPTAHTQAFAAKLLAKQTVTQEDDETTTIEAVEFSARKATLRVSGQLIVSIAQGDQVIDSTSLSAKDVKEQFSEMTAEFDDPVEVEGSFDILVEFDGTGVLRAQDVAIAETETGSNDDDDDQSAGGSGDNDDSNTETAGEEISLDNLIAGQHVGQDEDDSMTIEAVEFSARKATLRTSGTLIVAIVQDGLALGTDEISVRSLGTGYTEVEATFDESVEVTGPFDIVILHDGKGVVRVLTQGDEIDDGNFFTNSAESPSADLVYTLVGDTETASGGGNDDEDGTSGTPDEDTDSSPTVQLTVNAVNQDGDPVEGMWIEIWQGTTMVNAEPPGEYTPHTFELQDGEYVVAVQDFGENEFVGWEDSSQGRYRFADLTNVDQETFTAIFSGSGSTDTASNSTGGTDDGTTDGNTDGTGGDDSSNTPTVGAGQVGVKTVLLDGTDAPGFQTQLRDTTGTPIDTQFSPATFENVEPDQRIVMYSAENTYFRHWSDNGLHRYHTIESSDIGDVLTARYETVPADQAAHLTVIAKTSDGQTIGGTTGSDTDGSLNATPGLEVLVAPPGTMTPYTAGFTGGSEISEHFYFFKGQTYTIVIQEYPPYTFSHWEDNPSLTSRSRVVNLSGDTTLVAIFNAN